MRLVNLFAVLLYSVEAAVYCDVTELGAVWRLVDLIKLIILINNLYDYLRAW